MKLSPAILISLCAILGVFILGNLFVQLIWRDSDSQYNLGCYLHDNQLNKTASLQARIAKIKTQHQLAHSIAYMYPSLIANESNFLDTSLQLANSFEVYLQKMTQKQNYNKENMEIMIAVNEAQRAYDSCRKAIEQEYKSSDCNENWIEYENCFGRVGDIRHMLDDVIKEGENIKNNITEWIKLPQQGQSGLEWAKRIYNESMDNNTRVRDQLQKQLSEYETQHNKNIIKKEQTIEQKKIISKSYQECSSNRKEYTTCQEISREVSSINIQTLEELKVMIKAKQELLSNLRSFLKDQQNSKEIDELHKVYTQQAEEYKSMMKEFINFNKETQKACGCTQQQEKEYFNELSILTKGYQGYLIKIAQLEVNIADINKKLRKVEEEREVIFQAYKAAIQSNQNTTVVKDSQLKILNQQLEAKNKEIISLKQFYYSVFDDCNSIKARMTERVHDVDNIGECMAKKDYFEKLKGQTKMYLHPDNEPSRILESKSQLVKYLQAFEL